MENEKILKKVYKLIKQIDNRPYKNNSIIKRNYYWYKRASARNRVWWYFFQVLAFITSFSTSILIAFTEQNKLSRNWKITLIIISGISTASISIIGIFKIFELWKIRDEGRFAFYKLKNDSKKKYMHLKQLDKTDSGEILKLYKMIIQSVNKIEEKQTQSFLGLFGNKDKNNS